MIKIKFETTKSETVNDVVQATKVATRAFVKAYHRAKARQLEKSLHRLQDIEKQEQEERR